MLRKPKFYRKNEKDTLKALGLDPVPGSGSGWIHKEDGESENLLVQLKSTDKSSYRIELLDIKKLEYHASVSHKLPVFLIQFLQQNKIYALVNIEDIDSLYELINEPEKISKPVIQVEENSLIAHREVKSSLSARNRFYKDGGC